ncbi:hypothetical protein [Heyndrickxia coagulans]|jgi:hypothetical protein|uniref:hypothetical protein n=1 Tax=Heyndrickxia coagulans TaxID=1398 RepID=UPI000795F407|nr:hypothetical protein [Heyndrickxia coagulans]KYC61014.1 hypothetical protein B4100_0023 [Heyndrickxia coagulans]
MLKTIFSRPISSYIYRRAGFIAPVLTFTAFIAPFPGSIKKAFTEIIPRPVQLGKKILTGAPGETSPKEKVIEDPLLLLRL